jgi:hypothetical protein
MDWYELEDMKQEMEERHVQDSFPQHEGGNEGGVSDESTPEEMLPVLQTVVL